MAGGRWRLNATAACIAAVCVVVVGGQPLVVSAAEQTDLLDLGSISAVLGGATLGDYQPPTCEYDSVETQFGTLDDWDRAVLDTTFHLPDSYVPTDLVSVSRAGVAGAGMVRELVIDDLRAMGKAAKKAGAEIAASSGYRSYVDQKVTFNRWSRQYGYQRALKVSARAGHSEHQLGTTIDVRSADSFKDAWDYSDWAETKPGAWMKKNAWRYGFVLSYPKDQRDNTCYSYESWHYRYVGKNAARDIHDSGLTPREYLWSKRFGN